MSLKRRLEKLEKAAGKGEKGVVFYDMVVTEVSKDNEPIYYFKKVAGDKKITLTLAEYEKDAEQEKEKGNTVILDDIDCSQLSTGELKILSGKE